MATIETHVAGVTFHNVNFASIKKSSKVQIIPEPTNPYDKNALKVVIDGTHVGYIKKELAETLTPKISSGAYIKAKVKSVVGWNKPNQGIILTLSIFEKSDIKRSNEELGGYVKNKASNIKIIEAPNPITIFDAPVPSWKLFLEEKKGIPQKIKEPCEPNYKHLYKKEVPFWRRLFFKNFETFKKKKHDEWIKKLAVIKEKNKNRDVIINKFSRRLLESEYNSYIKSKQIEYIFNKLNISFASDEEILQMIQQGYLTIYEQILYNYIKRKFLVYRQVNLDNLSYDLLLISLRSGYLWIIEIDGNIHSFEIVKERDEVKEALAIRKGISVIRMTNWYIGHNLKKMLEKLNKLV